MRLDDYRCLQCGRIFEALLEGSDKASCPSCASAQTVRELSAFKIGGASRELGGCASGGCDSRDSDGGCANGMCGL